MCSSKKNLCIKYAKVKITPACGLYSEMTHRLLHPELYKTKSKNK